MGRASKCAPGRQQALQQRTRQGAGLGATLFKDLQGQGIVRLGYGEIEILDPQRLREAAHS